MADAKAADSSSDGVVPNPKARLLDQVREIIRVKHYSIRTEEAYVQWIKRFIFFHGKRHPREMGAREIEAFLTDLAVRGKVAASTQNQALNALVFLSSCQRNESAASGEGSGAAGWNREARQLPFSATFVRHAPIGIRLRHPNRPGIARAQGREHHADLHACDAEAGVGGAESAGWGSVGAVGR